MTPNDVRHLPMDTEIEELDNERFQERVAIVRLVATWIFMLALALLFGWGIGWIAS